MKVQGRNIVFETTGREVYANCGIIGIDSDLDVSEGYDGGIHIKSESLPSDEDLTKEEIIELSAYMINLWTRFKNKYS